MLVLNGDLKATGHLKRTELPLRGARQQLGNVNWIFEFFLKILTANLVLIFEFHFLGIKSIINIKV